jgi:hypothetical protein
MKKVLKLIQGLLSQLFKKSLRAFPCFLLFLSQAITGNMAANAQSAPPAPLCSFPAAWGCEFQIKVTNRAYGGRLPGCNTLYPIPGVDDKLRLAKNCRADTTANLTFFTQLIKNEIASNPSQGACGTLNYAVETNIFNDAPPAYGSFATTAFDRLYITYGYNSDAYLSSGSINLAACPKPPPSIRIITSPSRTPFIANETGLNGRSGQHYAIDIEISNGPTTAPITFNMQLPGGVTIKTADPISAVGASIVCTGSALSTCSIPAGAPIGRVLVSVFVEVANSTTNAQASVTAIGGGDAKCTGLAPACTGSTAAIPILDAIGESANKPQLTASTTDVSTNDKSPPNAEYNLGTGSTCANASISKTGIASYTSPAAVVNSNAACTVEYRLCAPPPSRLICKDATLTVSTQRAINNNTSNVVISNNEEKDPVAPVFKVTKTASGNPLFIGKPGQFYTINITVQNSSVSAPILLLDKLPLGLTTSGPVSAVGGTISGCPGAGANDLAGCSISVKSNNYSIVVTVPISVAIGASSGANTATIKGGGSALCTGVAPACTGSTGPISIVEPVDAIDDAVSQPAGANHTFNVSTNDKYPAGSIFAGGSFGSTCLGVSVSTTGIASYTLPAFNSSAPTCIVQYQVCAPATSQAGCDSALLRVTMYEVNAVADLISVITPNAAYSSNVTSNDKYPLGSQFSLDGTSSTCLNAQISSTGTASYNSPANGSSCIVKYKLCAPTPYQTACDTATLTVSTFVTPGCSSLALTYQATVPANSPTNAINTSGNGCSFFALGSTSQPIILPAGSYKVVGSVVPFGTSTTVAMPLVTFTLNANGFLKGKAEYDSTTSKWKLTQIP